MPVKIPDGLPAREALEKENIFIMGHNRAEGQDIRPLKILILNLMPTKSITEVQLLRLLSNTPLQIEVELMQTASYTSKNTSAEYLDQFYTTFDAVKNKRYDGMIITGAPVEKLPFEEVDYWPELCRILDWSKKNVYSVFHICWGAQAALYHFYGLDKYDLPEKLSGVYLHDNLAPAHPLLRGFDDQFFAPHSRYSQVDEEALKKVPELQILAASPQAGLYLAAHKNGRQFFATGHGEYDRDTLAKEYERDVKRGLNPRVPENYFPQDDPTQTPLLTWRSHEMLLFSNWLNYFVYQGTPYDLNTLD